MEPTKPFWNLLQTECVSACCGIDAFNLWGENIQKISIQVDINFYKKEFKLLISNIYQIESTNLASSFLNNLFDKKLFIKILDHIIAHL